MNKISYATVTLNKFFPLFSDDKFNQKCKFINYFDVTYLQYGPILPVIIYRNVMPFSQLLKKSGLMKLLSSMSK